MSFSSALTGQLAGKQQPVKGATVRLARVQDSNSTLGLSMPGLSALLAGKKCNPNLSSIKLLIKKVFIFTYVIYAYQYYLDLLYTFIFFTGTPSADNPIPGINSASSLLERLTASSNQGSQPTSPMTSPPPANVNLQGVNLANLPNSINGLQNVQVLIIIT